MPFLGLRFDKDPRDVIYEPTSGKQRAKATNAPKSSAAKTIRKAPKKYPYLNADSNWKAVDAYPVETVDPLVVGDCTIDVTNKDLQIWPGFEKIRLLVYYHDISHYILPHIYDRPQSLHVKLLPPGKKNSVVHAKRFFIKDMENRQPSCVDIFSDERNNPKPGKRNRIDYMVANNIEALLYMINVGCIDVNPWAARRQSPRYPDYLFIDLDPTIPDGTRAGEDKGFAKAVEAAMVARDVLKHYKLTSFIKTSGQTGLHIYVPCAGLENKEEKSCRRKARILCEAIHEQVKNITTLEIIKDHRGDKVFLDYVQNDYADTISAPYCVRPYHEPLVSCPLDWKEVRPGLDRWKFTTEEVKKRLQRKGDLFSGVRDPQTAVKNTIILNRL